MPAQKSMAEKVKELVQDHQNTPTGNWSRANYANPTMRRLPSALNRCTSRARRRHGGH